MPKRICGFVIVSAILKPATADDVIEAVGQALADAAPLEILGQGTKRGFGRPVQAARQLDLSGLAGITLYEPAELVLTCAAGTKLAEIETALAAQRQQLAFEPPDFAPLWGGAPGRGTIGGVLGCNLSGPRRLKAGAARDHFLGFKAVSGRGELFQAGGRVVKNVTGYDLCKLMAGSFGTLAVLTEVTVKVLPAPEKTRTVLLYGLDDAAAIRAMAAALAGVHEVSAAAHLPAGIAARAPVDHVAQAGRAVTALRVEGPGPSVEHRCAAMRRELASTGAGEELHSLNSARLWQAVRDVAPLLPDKGRILWRLSVPPASGARIVGDLGASPLTLSLSRKGRGDAAVMPSLAAASPSRGEGWGEGGAANPAVEWFYDWAGGLIWLSLPPAADAAAATVRGAVAAHGGGHATLVRAPDAVRAAVPVFEPQPEGLAALEARIKETFDPRRILNPGRMSALL